MSEATAWSAGADGFVETAVGITGLDLKMLQTQALHHLLTASGEAEKTTSLEV